MRILFGLAALGALAALGVTAASARPSSSPLSDAAYLEAARCVGIASSKTMAQPDAKAMQAWFQSEAGNRPSYILDKGDQVEQDARREANHADDYTRQRLEAELSGECATLRG